LLGNGDGTFQPAVTFDSGGLYPRSIAVADVNGDGKLDVLVADYNSGAVGVLLNVSDYTTSPSTTVLDSSSPNPSTFGESVTFVASVSSPAGTPTGTVEFFNGAIFLGNGTLVSGQASFSASWLAVGSHSIIAKYEGDGVYLISTSGPFSQIVNVATTTTSLLSSMNPARPKESITYTATVASQYGGAATGTATFKDGGVAIATVALSGNQAAYSTSYPKAGLHSITATYSGDANNTESVSPPLVEQINKDYATKTVVTTSGSPSFVGGSVTFTATVKPNQGAIPDGELVTFYDAGTAIDTGTTAGGVAAFATSSLSARTHTIKATYAGDATFEPSTGSVKQVVDKYTTTTALSSSPNPSNDRQAVTFTATVTSSGPNTPTGKVEFKDVDKHIGSATLSGGVATLTTLRLDPFAGTHFITAEYIGDANSAESTSPVLDQVVE
jgi:hypothetical protein